MTDALLSTATGALIALGLAVAALFLLAPLLTALDEVATIASERSGARDERRSCRLGADKSAVRRERKPVAVGVTGRADCPT